ncbi:hypothetical protein NBRC116596_27880 [Litorivita sp. NS0012-18]
MVGKGDIGQIIAQERDQFIADKERQFRSCKFHTAPPSFALFYPSRRRGPALAPLRRPCFPALPAHFALPQWFGPIDAKRPARHCHPDAQPVPRLPDMF